MRNVLLFPALAAIGALSVPALGQAPSLQDVLAGRATPVTLHLKELNSDWSRVSVGTPGSGGLGDLMSQLAPMMAMSGNGKGGGSDAAMGMAFLSSMFGGGSAQQTYYTRGQTTAIGGETFLIAYHYVKQQPNFMQLIMESQANGGKEPDFSKLAGEGKLTPDSPLTLSLINVKSVNTLGDIRPFDMAREIADSQNSGGGLFDLLAAQSKDKGIDDSDKVSSPVHGAPVLKPAKKAGGK